MAAERMGGDIADLEVADGTVHLKSKPDKTISYGELIGGKRFSMTLKLGDKRVHSDSC
jgi:nicotinate dehydrogenase subunit B